MVSIWTDKSPGVYREETFLKPEPKLSTGVAGFVGFAEPIDPAKPPVVPYTPVALHHREDFAVYFKADEKGYLADAVDGYFVNGGRRCYVAYAKRGPVAEAVKALEEAVEALATLHDLDVVAVPDAMNLGDAMAGFQGWLLQHCVEQGDRFAILDVPKDITIDSIKNHRDEVWNQAANPWAIMNGAIYYPWVKDISSSKAVPPCGHIAGIFARSDARVGVFKAPANEEVLGIVDIQPEVTDSDQKQLNPLGINCLRAFPGRGIRIWGARTLSDDPQWRYINVRRLFITVRRWIDMSMGWAVFEPNTPQLRTRIERELGGYLLGLWRLGALQGQTPEQAFYVKCDAETNPPNGPEERVVTEIGLAPIAPAEFVVVRIVHRTPIIAANGGE